MSKVWRSRWKRESPPRDGLLPRSLDHLKSFTEVYEPSDDTYLFVDCLRYLGKYLREEYFHPDQVLCFLEVGSGSGVLSAVLAEELQDQGGVFGFAVDCNPSACEASLETFRSNGLSGHVEVIQSDLIPTFLNSCIDIFLFNPPCE